MRVCIYGASSTKTDKKYIDAVESLGESLARRGHSLVYGGGGNGLMGAAARGFTKGKGHIIGVVPHFFNVDGILYDKCDEMIRTDTMRERKQRMEDEADVFIITPGGVGTFDEFFEILTLKQLGRHSKAIVIFNVCGYYDKLEEFMRVALSEFFITEATTKLYTLVDNEEELIDYIEKYEGKELSFTDTKYV
ncbi:MAG: TIGR00730 family Rossman fold protein [Clostridia bacterium]|nr:TIGR00730 family Rossman fold protein [Clostridia bacterium]